MLCGVVLLAGVLVVWIISSRDSDEYKAAMARKAARAKRPPVTHTGVNAVDLYKEAVLANNKLTTAEQTMLQQRLDEADPAAAAALYVKIQPVMELVRRARKADYADWGPDSGTYRGHFSQQYREIVQLSYLAYWESAYRFKGDPDRAVTDLAATEALGRSGVDSLTGLWIEESRLHRWDTELIAQNAERVSSTAPDLAYIEISPEAAQQMFQQGMSAEAEEDQTWVDDYEDPLTRSAAAAFIQTSDHFNYNGDPYWYSPLNPGEWRSLLLSAGYTMPATTISPDGRYGITVPSLADAITDPKNEVIEIKTGRIVGAIPKEYAAFDRMNHGGIVPACWTGDDSMFLWQVDGKWGFDTEILVKLERGKIKKVVDVLNELQQEFLRRARQAVPNKYAAVKAAGAGDGSWWKDGFATDFVLDSSGRPLKFPMLFHCFLSSDPKGAEDKRDKVEARMTAQVNEDGTFKVDDFYLGANPPARTW